ncbi:MAG: cysteine desulfurase [FCB group bacterium]|nr:cysteine desulfurase [FCB group bacterium]
MRKIYCDHAATTPVAPEISRLMEKVQRETWGNPSSLHRYGQTALAVVEKSRRQIAATLSCSPAEILFTGSGSEANNLILRGLLSPGDHFITSTVEHASVYKTALVLKKNNIEVSFIKPDNAGRVRIDQIEKFVQPNTKLISCMHANNELGTLNPIEEIAMLAKEHHILFHTDAIQSYGKFLLDMTSLKADSVSLSAHKIQGPKGVGVLYLRKGLEIKPLITGGGQERNLRAGTENIAGIAGFGLAAELIYSKLATITAQVAAVTNIFMRSLKKLEITHRVNGRSGIPGLVSITFPDISAETLLINLDLEGIAISAGSACSAGTLEPSRVLAETGLSAETASRTVRISFGSSNHEEDGIAVAEAIRKIIDNLQKQDMH